MKNLFYHRERILPLYLGIVFAFTFFYLELYVIHAESIDIKFLVLAIVCFAVLVITVAKSLILVSRKNKCLAEGKEIEGLIVGKVGVTLFSGGYCYRLVVEYDGSRTVTPPMKAKFADRLKSEKCKVYVFEDMSYVTGFALCKKDEDPAEIKVMQKSEINQK